jgi:radical SAM superfamily enzyme YgiQ (UPF0313 family)
MVTPYQPKNRRKILCIFSRYTKTFGTFHYAYEFFPDTVAFMPPQGLLTVASYLPKSWEVRFVDENVRIPTDEEYAWCDAVFASGMHVQKKHLANIAARAHEHGKVAVIGGPSVSACPDYYPTFDILHVGEMGDATDQVIAHLDRDLSRPKDQVVYTTESRVALDDFPIPAYDQIDLAHYFVSNIQWSSGCPFTCDFCDIPELYGRNPRVKSPERICAELDAILAKNPVGAVYFVDDNFIGNKKAAKQLLPHLVAWQKRTGYRLRFGLECTLNLAQDHELLALMREAFVTDVFFGIESPDEEILHGIDKSQNVRIPMLEAVAIINSYGIELHAGIILGLDGAGEDEPDKILDFIAKANIPLLAINVLYALPKTPLWRKLEKQGRLIATDDVEESNVVFELPTATVMEQWRRVIREAYTPEALYRRYKHNLDHTYPNRKVLPLSRYHFTWQMIRIGAVALSAIFYRLGVRGSYKKEFWKMAAELLRSGKIDHLVYIASMSHHLLKFAEDVASDRVKACFYTEKVYEPLVQTRTQRFTAAFRGLSRGRFTEAARMR